MAENPFSIYMDQAEGTRYELKNPKIQNVSNYSVSPWDSDQGIGLSVIMVTVKTDEGNALFWNVQLNFREGVEPRDRVMVWASNRYAYDHDPLVLADDTAEAQGTGFEKIDQNFEGEPFLNYICQGTYDEN
jgi:hypothetical protein